ncbi:hypothetical protein EKO27_g8707 [Xylaria grammica]|uniref:Uncharacterized protein n=1 Tax=Xylaria grammica TaxID=363999 RepID=A0A439CWJ6_9PEZI|nr:hypothetical protein EKO27_g8707 [Xylaria grammica]
MGRDGSEASQSVPNLPSSNDRRSNRTQADGSRSPEARPLIMRRVDQSRSDPLHQEWHIEGMVNGFSVDVLADSGSTINGISKDEADRVGAVVIPDTAGQPIRLPSGETCLSLGIAAVEFNFEGEKKTYKLRCNIVESLEWAMIVCYDFLKTTETLTRFFAERIKEISLSSMYCVPLSLAIEENTVSDGRGARMQGFINSIRTTVVPDTASAIMAMSTSCADLHMLEIDTTQRKNVTFVDGSTELTRGVIKSTWIFLNPNTNVEPPTCLVNDHFHQAAGPDDTIRSLITTEETDDDEDDTERDPWDYVWEYEWHVIDGLPVDAVLSLDFIKQHDVFNKHQHSFLRPSVLPAVPEILGICELPGGSKGLINLAEAFLIDLASPDPFSLNMIVRESARRSEIQRTILTLPGNVQSAQRDMEEHRIASWGAIKELEDRGGDWKLRRDEYLASLRPQQTQTSSLPSPDEQGGAPSHQEKYEKRRFWRRRSRNGDSGAAGSAA